MTDTTPEPTDVQAPSTAPDSTTAASTIQPGIVCDDCGRARTLADDYDYTPLQIGTGRPLGWFNGDNEQMCGECLTATMKGLRP